MRPYIYLKVRKEGIKACNNALENNESPYLPTLHELNPDCDGLPRINLGLMAIPIDRIMGTVTKGRSTAFARNFMPILEPGSEFAEKWLLLYDSVEENGVNMPVSCVEYMGYYYLLEGNKRVSVMKALGCGYIEAEVTRYLAPHSDTPESKAYYAYMEFARLTGIYDILFSAPESYRHITKLTGNRSGSKWKEESAKELKSNFLYFSEAYKRLFPDERMMSSSDAFLKFVVAYDYRKLSQKSFSDLDSDISRLKREFELGASAEPISLILDNDGVRSGGIKGLLFAPSRIKTAFLYADSPYKSGWNHWHDLGRIDMENELGDKVETSCHVVSSRTAFEEKVNELIAGGTNLIFATNPMMLTSCIKPSVEHPEVKLLCCSLLASYHHVRSYYLRTYEVKFLLGMAAGLLSCDGRIGYVADNPIYGTAAAINAFALGARMTNPRARVVLKWSSLADFDMKTAFEGENINVICNRDISSPAQDSLEYGLYTLRDGKVHNVACPMYNWGVFYTMVAKNMLNAALDDDENGISARDYWWGMSSDALDIQLSPDMDAYSRRLIEYMAGEIRSGSFMPFEGLLIDNEGNVRCEAEQRLTPAEIMCMDFLCDNVEGAFPDFSLLSEKAKPLVRLQGLNGELKPDVAGISWIKK